MRRVLIALTFILAVGLSVEKTEEEWEGRAIYQILTDRFARDDDLVTECNLSKYCGGTHKGIIRKLDYIKGMGFDAIIISPVIENLEGSYHGHHFTNLYKMNPHFGDENDLKELVEACHAKDIWVMVDVNANHVAPVGHDFKRITPFNSSEHYHEICKAWEECPTENEWYDLCPDLKQENEWVTEKLVSWIEALVQEYNLDGIRISFVEYVPKWFWLKFTKAAGVFQIGEVFHGNPNYVAGYQGPVASLFNYPLYYTIRDSFCGNMKNIESYWMNTRNIFPDPSLLGVFVEDHENPRFLNMCQDHKKFKNAVIFSLFFEGIPVFYYGGEQFYSGGAPPNNREPLWGNYNTQSEMYVAIAAANKCRKEYKIWNSPVVQRYADDVFYAFTRGYVLIALTRGEACQRTITYHNFKEGDKLCNIFDSSDCITVEGGNIKVNMRQDPKVYAKV